MCFLRSFDNTGYETKICLDHLRPGCVVYSVGVGYQWTTEVRER